MNIDLLVLFSDTASVTQDYSVDNADWTKMVYYCVKRHDSVLAVLDLRVWTQGRYLFIYLFIYFVSTL
jgi:hypothetical protein